MIDNPTNNPFEVYAVMDTAWSDDIAPDYRTARIVVDLKTVMATAIIHGIIQELDTISTGVEVLEV